MTRRQLLAAPALGALAQAQTDGLAPVIERHDAVVEQMLRNQITDAKHRWRGIWPDEYGIYFPGSAPGVIDTLAAAYLHPRSKYHKNSELPSRIRLAIDLLAREQSADGNWNLPTTNFNSPPDTGFIVRATAPAAGLLRKAGERELWAALEPVLRKAGDGMVNGGIHTPNHRWVVSAALAQLYELFDDEAYVRRIDQWLAEGIDIDSDGQFTERSTYVYNPITDAAFVTMAAKLKRSDLLTPARRNLESMLYLLHPGFEVVTEISRRQDLNIKGDMGPYWFPLAYLARADNDGRFATIEQRFRSSRAQLSTLLEYPELAGPGPAPMPVTDNYRKEFSHNALFHIRRGDMSAVVLGGGRNRFFTFRNADAVINAVRFASAFFGKGQFSGQRVTDRNGALTMSQTLEGPYYQPLDPPRRVNADEWEATRAGRKRTEVARMVQSVTITESDRLFRVRIQAEGTADVPLAVEINLREGGKLEGVEPARNVKDGFLLRSGYATYRVGDRAVRFGPGVASHTYTQVRGADAKLAGPSVYLTAVTPFDHTIEFAAL